MLDKPSTCICGPHAGMHLPTCPQRVIRPPVEWPANCRPLPHLPPTEPATIVFDFTRQAPSKSLGGHDWLGNFDPYLHHGSADYDEGNGL